MIHGPEAWGPTVLRVVLGAIYVMHGYHALAVAGVAGVAAMTVAAGFPPAFADGLAWYLVVAHLVGGVLLLIGLWTRAAALAQVPIMLGAVFMIHAGQGFFLHGRSVEAPAGPRLVAAGYEYALLVLAATVALALLGPGALSVDQTRAHGRRIEMP